MLIVLEGCDGCGKTTLAENLALILDAEIVHCTSQTPNNFDFFMTLILKGVTNNIIADRFCYGQFVYQTEEERRAKGWLTLEQLHTLEHMMGMLDVKVFHVIAPVETINKRLAQRDETVINGLTVREVIDRFHRIMFWTAKEIDTSKVEWWVMK